jgi:hypothetical protein
MRTGIVNISDVRSYPNGQLTKSRNLLASFHLRQANGRVADAPGRGKRTHPYKAKLVGRKLHVTMEDEKVEVQLAGSSDNCTFYCYLIVTGEFIGGWQTRADNPKPIPIAEAMQLIVASINRGIVYGDMNSLPSRPPKV